jgi:ribosome-binding protein aMBF1 (putative translation factor)
LTSPITNDILSFMIGESTPLVAFFDKSRKFIRMTDNELAEVIGTNIRAARTAAGLTQADLAGKCGMKVPNISRLEAGTHLPSVATLKKVSDALEVPICSLLDPPEPPGRPKKPKT